MLSALAGVERLFDTYVKRIEIVKKSFYFGVEHGSPECYGMVEQHNDVAGAECEMARECRNSIVDAEALVSERVREIFAGVRADAALADGEGVCAVAV